MSLYANLDDGTDKSVTEQTNSQTKAHRMIPPAVLKPRVLSTAISVPGRKIPGVLPSTSQTSSMPSPHIAPVSKPQSSPQQESISGYAYVDDAATRIPAEERYDPRRPTDVDAVIRERERRSRMATAPPPPVYQPPPPAPTPGRKPGTAFINPARAAALGLQHLQSAPTPQPTSQPSAAAAAIDDQGT